MNALYTAALTPRTDVPEEIARILDGDEPRPQRAKVRTHFDRLGEEDRYALVAYCEELDCLHEDLGFIIAELDQAVAVLYSRSLHLKRLAIICHSDNFNFRVHAYREKAFKLVNRFLGLKLPEKGGEKKNSAGDGSPGFNEKLLKLLRTTRRLDVAELLEVFRRDKVLNEAIHFRHLAAHARAHREWPTISAGRRVDDRRLARSAAYKIDRETDLDRLHQRVQKRFATVNARLEQFRRDLVAHLERAATRR
jgi:hypothetical protein